MVTFSFGIFRFVVLLLLSCMLFVITVLSLGVGSSWPSYLTIALVRMNTSFSPSAGREGFLGRVLPSREPHSRCVIFLGLGPLRGIKFRRV